GEVRITVRPETEIALNFYVRIPGWAKGQMEGSLPAQKFPPDASDPNRPQQRFNVTVINKELVRISGVWKNGDKVDMKFPMSPERVYADPHVKADVGRVAIQRGPIVYCVEGVDNGGQVRNLVQPKDAKLEASFDKDL